MSDSSRFDTNFEQHSPLSVASNYAVNSPAWETESPTCYRYCTRNSLSTIESFEKGNTEVSIPRNIWSVGGTSSQMDWGWDWMGSKRCANPETIPPPPSSELFSPYNPRYVPSVPPSNSLYPPFPTLDSPSSFQLGIYNSSSATDSDPDQSAHLSFFKGQAYSAGATTVPDESDKFTSTNEVFPLGSSAQLRSFNLESKGPPTSLAAAVPHNSKFYIIKSNDFLDVQASYIANVWTSTRLGNERLNKGFVEANAAGVKVILLFSVTASEKFYGIAEMKSHVDFSKSVDIWQQKARWNGVFKLNWLAKAEVPSKLFVQIKNPANDGRPVTRSRDTQEVPYDVGMHMIDIFQKAASELS